MLKMTLSGCNGRMGRVISQMCAEHSQIRIAAGIDIKTVKNFDYPVYADPIEYKGSSDVIVDFSSPSQLEGLLSFATAKKLPIVLATTGYSPEQLELIEDASASIPIFRSANMSLGINLLADLIKKSCAVLGEDFDIEIVERHHNSKLDAPSGTALMLFDAAAEALPYDPEPVYNRHEVQKKRGRHEIGLHAIRGGTIVGDHDVIFAGHDEVITISHSAASREVFATGAVRAAIFMAGASEPRLYGMKDILA